MAQMDCTEIFDRFRNKVTDYDLLEVCPSYEEDILFDYLVSAVGDFCEWTGIEIVADEDERALAPAPTTREADILAIGMVYHWTSHILMNTDKMRNVMNTKDFSQFSPEKILSRLMEVRDGAYSDFRNRAVEHSFFIGG